MIIPVQVQRRMKLILNLCLSDGFNTFSTLLCADECSMIDRRMGIYGYPIEIQALFFFALRCAKQMLKPERGGKELMERIDKRITALSFHIKNYYWLDFTQLNNIYRYKTEEYSHTAVNKFNVIPESIPDWVFEFMPLRGGYLIGNVSPARTERDVIKLMVDAVENIKPICEVEKVSVAGTIYDVPGIVARDRQQTLAGSLKQLSNDV